MTEISITLLFAEDKAKEYVRGEAAPPCKLYEYVPPHVVHFVSILGQNCVLYFAFSCSENKCCFALRGMKLGIIFMETIRAC